MKKILVIITIGFIIAVILFVIIFFNKNTTKDDIANLNNSTEKMKGYEPKETHPSKLIVEKIDGGVPSAKLSGYTTNSCSLVTGAKIEYLEDTILISVDEFIPRDNSLCSGQVGNYSIPLYFDLNKLENKVYTVKFGDLTETLEIIKNKD